MQGAIIERLADLLPEDGKKENRREEEGERGGQGDDQKSMESHL